jgi:hypothetical protein
MCIWYGGHACAVFWDSSELNMLDNSWSNWWNIIENEVKVLVVVGMEVNHKLVQYGDTASELKQVKCTSVWNAGYVQMSVCVPQREATLGYTIEAMCFVLWLLFFIELHAFCRIENFNILLQLTQSC